MKWINYWQRKPHLFLLDLLFMIPHQVWVEELSKILLTKSQAVLKTLIKTSGKCEVPVAHNDRSGGQVANPCHGWRGSCFVRSELVISNKDRLATCWLQFCWWAVGQVQGSVQARHWYMEGLVRKTGHTSKCYAYILHPEGSGRVRPGPNGKTGQFGASEWASPIVLVPESKQTVAWEFVVILKLWSTWF